MNEDGFNDGVFKAWFAFCAVVALVIISVVLWAVVTVVNHFT